MLELYLEPFDQAPCLIIEFRFIFYGIEEVSWLVFDSDCKIYDSIAVINLYFYLCKGFEKLEKKFIFLNFVKVSCYPKWVWKYCWFNNSLYLRQSIFSMFLIFFRFYQLIHIDIKMVFFISFIYLPLRKA